MCSPGLCRGFSYALSGCVAGRKHSICYELVEWVVELAHAVSVVNVNVYGGSGGTFPFVFNLNIGWGASGQLHVSVALSPVGVY